MPSGRGVHRASTRVMSLAMVVIGLVLVIGTLARGAGPLAGRFLIGLLFVAAGVARLYLATRDR